MHYTGVLVTQSSQKALDLRVLPLRDVVVFPYMVIPLFVGREKVNAGA